MEENQAIISDENKSLKTILKNVQDSQNISVFRFMFAAAIILSFFSGITTSIIFFVNIAEEKTAVLLFSFLTTFAVSTIFSLNLALKYLKLYVSELKKP